MATSSLDWNEKVPLRPRNKRVEATEQIQKLIDTPSKTKLFKEAPGGTYQEPLFASPAEILGHRSPENEKLGLKSVDSIDTLGQTENLADVLGKKYALSTKQFRESLAKEGQQSPTTLMTTRAYKPVDDSENPELTPLPKVGGIGIMNGNHRLAVAAVERPNDYIPVTFDLNSESDREAMRAGYPHSEIVHLPDWV